MDVKIDKEWKVALAGQWDQPYFRRLTEFVRQRYSEPTEVYPPAGRIFAAMDACPLSRTKVVIVGQDPYHGPGQANGLCFSVADGVKMPPSLVNIFKEVSADTGAPFPSTGNLERWAYQGVLLLNSILTVEQGKPASHQGQGWEQLTDAIIDTVSEQCASVVFMLWGSYAIAKGKRIDRSKHLVLESVHPSPLSAYRGFFGCRHFSRANQWLTDHGLTPIIW